MYALTAPKPLLECRICLSVVQGENCCVGCSLKDSVKDMDFMPIQEQQQHWQHHQQNGQLGNYQHHQQQQQQGQRQQQLLLATTSEDGCCQIWNVLTCSSVAQLELGRGECLALDQVPLIRTYDVGALLPVHSLRAACNLYSN
jgi:hypothetical protein